MTDVTRPARRRHVAAGGRVAAAGIGFSAMFGIVAVMGYAHRPTTIGPSQDPTSIPAFEAPEPGAPIPLTPNIVVRRSPSAQPTVASTHGSR